MRQPSELLEEDSVIQFFRITAADGKSHHTIVQDRRFESDFDHLLKPIEDARKSGSVASDS